MASDGTHGDGMPFVTIDVVVNKGDLLAAPGVTMAMSHPDVGRLDAPAGMLRETPT